MRPTDARRALVKGEAATIERVMSGAGIYRAEIRDDGDRFTIEPTSHFLSCHDDSPRTYQGASVVIGADSHRDFREGFLITLGDAAPKAGNVALAAFYDGWTCQTDLVPFRQGAKGMEGYNPFGGRWIPLARFRILGIVTAHRVEGVGIAVCVEQRNDEGVVFGEGLRMAREIRSAYYARAILCLDARSAFPLSLVLSALGPRYRPDAPHMEGHFVTDLHAWNLPHANETTRQYSWLYFEEEATIEPRDGLLGLAAYDVDGRARVGPVGLFERDGALWAHVAEQDDPLPPDRSGSSGLASEARTRRVCVCDDTMETKTMKPGDKTPSLGWFGRTGQGHHRLRAESSSKPGTFNEVLVSADLARISCDCHAAKTNPKARDERLTVEAAAVRSGAVPRLCWHLRAAADVDAERITDGEALAWIARRVWGQDAKPREMLELLADVERRIPLAIDTAAQAARIIRRAMDRGETLRFRAFVTVPAQGEPITAELGVLRRGAERHPYGAPRRAFSRRRENARPRRRHVGLCGAGRRDRQDPRDERRHTDDAGRWRLWMRFANGGQGA